MTEDEKPASRKQPAGSAVKASDYLRPRWAAAVVAVVALSILGVVAIAVLQLKTGPGDTGVLPDPNAATISAIAASAIAAMVSLTSAYFGVKVASESSAQALQVASQVSANSTTNGNPNPEDL